MIIKLKYVYSIYISKFKPNRNVVRSQSQRPPENPDTRKAKKYIENRGIEEVI